MRRLLILFIRGYQKYISPMKGPCCRFIPTCSEYAVTAISRFGAFRGGWLAFRRILRCSPLCPGGYDPVPTKFPGRKMKNSDQDDDI